MRTSRLKNKIKHALYTPKKSRILNSKNLSLLKDAEKALNDVFGAGSEKNKEEK